MKLRHLYQNEQIVALANFFFFGGENFEMNVVYFSKVCALNSFFFGLLLYCHVVTFLLSLYANNLIVKFL